MFFCWRSGGRGSWTTRLHLGHLRNFRGTKLNFCMSPRANKCENIFEKSYAKRFDKLLTFGLFWLRRLSARNIFIASRKKIQSLYVYFSRSHSWSLTRRKKCLKINHRWELEEWIVKKVFLFWTARWVCGDRPSHKSPGTEFACSTIVIQRATARLSRKPLQFVIGRARPLQAMWTTA